MDQRYTIPTKFMKTLVAERCSSDSMSLPISFCSKYGQCIPANVNLVLRNGDEIIVQFRKKLGVFVGMKQFFKHFDCSKGCILAFQYNGGDNFWVHVICSGIEYFGDIADDCGCKFVRIFISKPLEMERVALPNKFVERFGEFIPQKVTFCLSNGKKIGGEFDKVSKVFCRLHELFRATNLCVLDTMLFTYYGDGLFDVSVFSGECVEKTINCENLLVGQKAEYFELKVMPYHLLRYPLGVNISVRFKALTDKWNNFDLIQVKQRELSWNLDVRKRDTKVEIHSGWVQFRNDLNLQIGDVCVFKRAKSDRLFEVEVYKANL